MTDAYYELTGAADPLGEQFTATDLVRSTWSAAIQHAAPVSALLVRALEHCARRDDTRLSRVAVDLLGPVPADGDFWVRSRIERPGKQIELVTAEMLGPGPDGRPRPVARGSGWRLQQLDTADVMRAPAPPIGPLTQAAAAIWKRISTATTCTAWTGGGSPRPQRRAGASWIRPTVDLVKGETMTPLQRLFAVADCANGIGSKLDITRWTFLNNDLVVHVHRIPKGSGSVSAPKPATVRTESEPPSAPCLTKAPPWAPFSSRCWCGGGLADEKSGSPNSSRVDEIATRGTSFAVYAIFTGHIHGPGRRRLANFSPLGGAAAGRCEMTSTSRRCMRSSEASIAAMTHATSSGATLLPGHADRTSEARTPVPTNSASKPETQTSSACRLAADTAVLGGFVPATRSGLTKTTSPCPCRIIGGISCAARCCAPTTCASAAHRPASVISTSTSPMR
ncbi:hypothetical protein I553_8344 [Mycobacterium xenopi 4042]|uniref:Thioesterase-like superfamily protein n=1 Tax=Mycobacterium xenopi 4042 TaxID=1299334 RepID=X8BLR7_MYCXE|nr:hypothetical protein I553_8344 [Mycobacterium xenopi 4042]